MSASPPSSAPVLLWVRRELRLRDNPALAAAIATGRPVVPVFVLDQETPGKWAPGGASRWWLHHSLASLAADLKRCGVQLVLRRGRYDSEIPRLVQESGAVEIHAGLPIEPWARQAMRGLHTSLPIKLHVHRTTLLFEPASIVTGAGGPYSVFTPFARACRARGMPAPPIAAPERIKPSKPLYSDRLEDWGLLPTHPDWAVGLRETWKPGEDGAAARLAEFAGDGVDDYADRRNVPGQSGTSMLSPHLAWGEISPAEIWHAVTQAGGAGVSSYLNEILWREFCAHLLWHNPHLPDAPLRPAFAAMPWRTDKPGLRAWQQGKTGYPIVDAGMRQLWRTGWMHNRVRMITASFLIKHLLLDWRVGEAWFWDTLVDADLATNAASWQWVAGSGADAAPFFRVFNPVLQGEKFDPDGAYVRRYVPELGDVPDRHIHAPWQAPPDLLALAGVLPGRDYPAPLVELGMGRIRALEAYKKLGRAAGEPGKS